MSTPFIAHRRKSDGCEQSLAEHLISVATLARENAEKIGLGYAGEVVGLLHDLGKYSQEFVHYLLSAENLIDPDADDYVDAASLKGKIDHSSAGAQYVWGHLSQLDKLGVFVGQLLALCIASHHSGLIDCISASYNTNGEDIFTRRMHKPTEKTHLDEVVRAADQVILTQAIKLLNNPHLLKSVYSLANIIIEKNKDHENKVQGIPVQQQLGLMARFLFSCLIDADRTDTADFEHKRTNAHRQRGNYIAWRTLADHLEAHLNSWKPQGPIDTLRRDISGQCLKASRRQKGIYTLTVPTGGGKTLASLRFALHHAGLHGLDRIVYVIPFTSIIDQNAEVVRKILETTPEDRGRIVLEHHSDLTPEQQTWQEKILCENWDAPVVYTTMVQFLESLFGRGTRGARRMHQLANSVIIFDEIQTLPVKCVHLFNNAINFLVEQTGSTVVLCTATQPLLHKVNQEKGAIRLSSEHEIVKDPRKLFDDLKRVKVNDIRKPGGWSYEEVANRAMEEIQQHGSCLVIVNTKDAARQIYQLSDQLKKDDKFHLSTGMCPAHRKQQLATIRQRLIDGLPVLCISTQLIEAGVDVDFHSVIRFLAGIDSIAQAAGRCNRNGFIDRGSVYVVNPSEEHLSKLPDIAKAAEVGRRVLDDFLDNEKRYRNDHIGPEAIEDYYRYYFFERKDDMSYPVKANHKGGIGQDDTLLNLLSGNHTAVESYRRSMRTNPNLRFLQAFMTAANAFESIDAPTRGIIVQFKDEGKQLVSELCGAYEVEKQYNLLKRAQQFTVNVFPHVLDALAKAEAVHPIQKDVDILYLDERYYSDEFGLTTESISELETWSV